MGSGKSSTKAGGVGKRPKKFLDQSAALSLATSIAEQKSHKTAEKLTQCAKLTPVTQKKTKALLAARISESKKAKNKRRKTQRQSRETLNGDDVPTPPMKKSVSFA
ncbi:hypothetical protein C8F04DRAFT_1176568 [Mycena alexandri]|uniref:Uncharacterized protein n=1 Tax=Mycena alexandri TaxID=1745969 RepID=A0AAD6TAP4_9AGAR|nr:hypothetical protein C8F04DRAFT_1176568 [Mycena alexandri]